MAASRAAPGWRASRGLHMGAGAGPFKPRAGGAAFGLSKTRAGGAALGLAGARWAGLAFGDRPREGGHPSLSVLWVERPGWGVRTWGCSSRNWNC